MKMKPTTTAKLILVPALLAAITACAADQGGNRTVIKEPGKEITVIENGGQEAGSPDISVAQSDPYEHIQISDWIDEETVIVVKDNEDLGKMSLEELADSYPRSLYTYNLATKQYELLKEKSNTFLGEASLSPDKKYLLYSEFSLGDPAYYVMSLDTKESFPIAGEPIAGAMSGHWASDGTVVGTAYSGGAYIAEPSGTITAVEALKQEALFIIRKINDTLYYNTQSDDALSMLNLATNETAKLPFTQVYGVFPSPDGNQLLILQYKDTKSVLVLSDADGSNPQTIAEGAELGAVSWSPDQRLVAYSLKASANGTTVSELYVYDLLAGKSTPFAVDVENLTTSWSPSGEALAYTEWNGSQFNSRVLHLQFSLQK